jgi:hypothetical protein
MPAQLPPIVEPANPDIPKVPPIPKPQIKMPEMSRYDEWKRWFSVQTGMRPVLEGNLAKELVDGEETFSDMYNAMLTAKNKITIFIS